MINILVFALFIMDVKTLLDNLHDEVSCSVCMCTFTEPKQLPCLHSFCLHCLNGIHRTSPNPGIISCPECRKEVRIPGSGSPSEFPTNFRINSLLDVLAIKECNTTGVKCGNCDKRSANCFYCFQCCYFWCEDCITGHNIIRANKDHRVLAITDFQDQDIEEVLKRPAFCPIKRHENEELKFYCKDCKVAICNSCVVTLHDGHSKTLLEDGANEHKLHIKTTIGLLKEKAQEERNEVDKFEQSRVDVQKKVADVKSEVKATADQMIAAIEARQQDIFNTVDNQATETLTCLALKKSEAEKKLKLIDSAIEESEKYLKRSSNADILAFNIDETFGTLLEEQAGQGSDLVRIPEYTFYENKKGLSILNTEGIGSVKTVFSTTKTQQPSAFGKENSKEIAEFQGKHVPDSPVKVQVQTKQFRPMLSIGARGESAGMLWYPWGMAVNDRNEIAVTELGNHRVSLFSNGGTYLGSFGKEGAHFGQFQNPTGIAFDNNGNIVVADSYNNCIQLFTRYGGYLNKFGDQGLSRDHQLKNPDGLSVTSTGDIIVADTGNKLIKIFSTRGQFVRKFGGQNSLQCPYHCIQVEQYLIVSDQGDHCIKVFDWEGNFLYKFGKEGSEEGEFNHPGYLSINKDGHLMVCDSWNHRVQVFEINGTFLTKFGREGRGTGEFMFPESIANLGSERIAVCDRLNNRIQVFALT